MTEPMPAETVPREIRRFTVTTHEGDTPQPGCERVRSEYVEEQWLPYIGPTALLLARRLDLALQTAGKHAVEIKRLAESMGVYPEEILAACHRLARYGLADWSERDPTLYLLRYWPKVPIAITTQAHRKALMALPDIGRETVGPDMPTLS